MDTPIPRSSTAGASAAAAVGHAAKPGAHPPTSKGFDPYNSGAFDKRQTWERVIRK